MSDNFANNPQGGTVATPTELASAADETTVSEDQGSESEDQQDQQTEEELEDFEYEGKKARIPSWVKPLTMFQADYTRKTTDIANDRKTFEDERGSFSKQVETHNANIKDIARAISLNDTIAEFEKLDWQSFYAQDQGQAMALRIQYDKAKDTRDKLTGEIRAKFENQAAEAQRARAKQLSEARATIQRDIPGWNNDLADKVTQFGMREFGFTPQELGQLSLDARMAKALHRAMIGDQAIKAAASAKKVQSQEGVKPVQAIGNRASPMKADPASPSGDKLSGAEWLKRRNEQLAKNRA